ncbi:hypothetical protein C8J57DRAFT_1262442 [Mycena rebaudengoi]|nr:hypothetical protein C8J57DRAFT_1262442 [Mycena rebaudengoi]
MCDGRASPPASPVFAKQGIWIITLQRQAEQHTPDAAWENTVMALRLGDRKARAPGYISSSATPPRRTCPLIPADPDRFGFGMWCAVQIVVAIARGVITVIVGDIADQRGVASPRQLKVTASL